MGLFSKWTAAKSSQSSLARRPRTWHGRGRSLALSHLAAAASCAGCSLVGAAAISARTFRRSTKARSSPIRGACAKIVNKRKQRHRGRRQLTLQMSF